MDKRNPLRILHVLGSADQGGTETQLFYLVTHTGTGFEHDICFLSQPGAIGRELECCGFRVFYYPLKRPWHMFSAVLQLGKLIRHNHYDILHLYGLKANSLGRILGRLAGHKKIVGGLRSQYPSGIKRKWTLWLDRLTFGLSLGYVSNSQAAVDFLSSRGYSREKFWVIHNGIDTESFLPKTEEAKLQIKKRFHVPVNRMVIACIANLRQPKGHADLIKALSRLKQTREDVLLVLVGDGPLRPTLEKLVKQLGLTENVLFMGFLGHDKIPEILAIVDVFVLPSLVEGLPTAVVEAMAAACPVVVTRVGGTPEVVNDGETGFLVDPGDPATLAERIAQLLSDGDLRRKMGEAARKRVEEKFSLENMVRQYEALYKEVAYQ
jgi:glycosyltransferase involved in cell wall biosynthesis